MKPSILITKRIYPEAVDFIRQHLEVDYESTDEGLTAEQLRERIRGKQAVVSQLTDKFSRQVIAGLEGVRIISNVAVGFDNVDVPAATEAGILVSNTPDVLTETTADLALGLMMAAARRIVEGHQFVHSGEWKKWAIDLLVGRDLHHATLGVIGLGRIGQAVARRAKGFSMRILYHDAVEAAPEVRSELAATFVPFDQLLAESDFVSIHVPLSETTRHLISERELGLMKSTAILVNTARGPVVDEEALANALRDGRIGGAGLDVFESEPKVHPGLLNLPQAVLAPHIGSASVDTRTKMSMMAVENTLAALEGRRPPNLVNPGVWDKLYAGR
ncbi:MAG: D-glycerate dehydrogenase [bacterium]|nr:D-glycerate dehydrogenase [bacterium]